MAQKLRENEKQINQKMILTLMSDDSSSHQYGQKPSAKLLTQNSICPPQKRCLYALSYILYAYLYKLRCLYAFIYVRI